jgi:hypothetical protein
MVEAAGKNNKPFILYLSMRCTLGPQISGSKSFERGALAKAKMRHLTFAFQILGLNEKSC